jgi:hypothetical protein
MADLPLRGGQRLETVAKTPYAGRGQRLGQERARERLLREGAVAHQLVGRVRAYQGEDG